MEESRVQFERFIDFACGVSNKADGPQLYYLEVKKMVATIRRKQNHRPLAVEIIKTVNEHRQLLGVQSEFIEKGFDVKVAPVESKFVFPSFLLQSFNESANNALSDPNGKELYYFQVYGFAAVIRAKADERIASICVAANTEEYRRLLQIKDKFADEGFDVEVVNFKSDENKAETSKNSTASKTKQ